MGNCCQPVERDSNKKFVKPSNNPGPKPNQQDQFEKRPSNRSSEASKNSKENLEEDPVDFQPPGVANNAIID